MNLLIKYYFLNFAFIVWVLASYVLYFGGILGYFIALLYSFIPFKNSLPATPEISDYLRDVIFSLLFIFLMFIHVFAYFFFRKHLYAKFHINFSISGLFGKVYDLFHRSLKSYKNELDEMRNAKIIQTTIQKNLLKSKLAVLEETTVMQEEMIESLRKNLETLNKRLKEGA